MDLIAKFWNTLVEWSEELHEFRRKNKICQMY
jgi:hypothetical protein